MVYCVISALLTCVSIYCLMAIKSYTEDIDAMLVDYYMLAEYVKNLDHIEEEKL